MSQSHAKFYFIQILYGLLYLHQQNIIYRDLKPENLLINHDGHIKIADFGLSKPNMKDKQLTYSFCGSTQYMPPQMILRQGHSFGVDFYTLGALLYQLVTGLPPFYSKNQQQIKQLILSQQLTFPSHIPLSTQIKNLLSGLLHKNQRMRIGSIRGLKQILFHPWVGRINAQIILSKQLQPPYIPNINQFNFDENQLGDDQQQFTSMLINQNYIEQKKQHLIYKDFEFINLISQKPQIKHIYDKYGKLYKNISQNIHNNQQQLPIQSKKKQFKKCNSLKNLNNRYTSDDFFKQKLKRQTSSPYLRSSSFNHGTSTKKNKNIITHLSKQKSKTPKKKQSLNKSSSKSKLKPSYKYSALIDKSLSTLLHQKSIKKKATKLNKQNEADTRLEHSITKIPSHTNTTTYNGISFLKKKKLLHSYLQN